MADRTASAAVGLDERDDAAAETAAGHPGAERAGREGGVDGHIELRHGDLEVVAQ